ncbi:ABC transporter permease [Pseudarthrobacter sp. J75]|uniref:ABC transporter permease n=1 Tax=Pseudarthrobacter sp. J75 TaxID=3116486 RepID=UPI002E821DE3|nr:ABC transporter permease [Pseudarthrobacter sp. J75]MEE2528769.1 ABC transporter permease [Pseudarthrobacter sp. J75]
MLRVALSQFTAHSRRFIAVGLAVMLAVAFLSTTLMVNASTSASLGASLGESYKKADLVIVPDGGRLDQGVLDAITGTAGVGSTYGSQRIPATFTANGEEVMGLVRNLAPESLESAVLTEGTYPGTPSDIAIDATTAQRLGIKTGATLQLQALDGPTSVSLHVTGLLRPSADPFSAALPQLLALSPTVGTLAAGDTSLDSIQVSALPGTNTGQLKDALAASIGTTGQSDATVRTADEQVTYQVASMTGGQDQLTGILLAFAAVALVVSGLVVSNTFAVLVAQRTRELALLRCLGAGRNQVRNSVLAEALVVGFVSSVLGVLAGTGLMAGLVSWAAAQPDRQFATLAVPPSAIISGLLAGVLLTVAAAYVPARAATAVAPLAALRPADDASLGNTKGKLRLVLGLAALVVGAPLLVFGAVQGQLVIGFAGGLLSFLGVLMCSTLFIPRLVSLVGKLAAPAGVPGRLAALNSVRNPGRTSVTAAALLIGVTLVTLMMSGAASSRTAFDQMLAKNYPVDLAVSLPSAGTSTEGTPSSGLTVEQRDAVRAIPGVSQAELLPVVGQLDVGGTSTPVYAIPAASAAALLRDQSLAVEPGKIYLPEDSATGPATVKGSKAALDLEAVVLETRSLPPFVSTETAQPLMAGTATTAGDALWISLGEADKNLSGDDIRNIQASVAQALGVPESAVSGAALERATFNEIIDVLLLVVTGLLAVAVVIALIGVANTLSLSVLERTRENSLLRALGLTRGQLRAMLALEAVLVAGVAALMGAALGSMYGWLGAMSALGSVATVSPSIPWLQLLAVLAVAVVAGLLASVVPARRAARLSPVEGLATA